MTGLGTNTKANYGWVTDDTHGRPELYYWQGTVIKWETTFQYEYSGRFFWCPSCVAGTSTTCSDYWASQSAYAGDGNIFNDCTANFCDPPCVACPPESNWAEEYEAGCSSWCQCQRRWFDIDWEINNGKSNKLYKLTYDNESKTVSRTLVWDGNATYVSSGDSTTGNLTFISRNVFLLTESDSPDDSGNHMTYRRVIVHANRLNEDGSVTPKIWSRVLLKDCAVWNTKCNDDVSDTSNTKNSYPGVVVGLTYIPPTSIDYDTHSTVANIIALTGIHPYGGSHTNDTGQQHMAAIWRLETDDLDIGNNNYEDSDAWNAGAEGGADGNSSWKLIKNFGAGDVYDFIEGWATCDSTGNLICGQSIAPAPSPTTGIMTLNTPIVTFPGNVLYDDDCDSVNNDCSVTNGDTMFVHDTTILEAPLSNSNRKVCHLHSVGEVGSAGDGLSDTYDNNDDIVINSRSALWAEGGCCDIFGQTQWGKDTIIAITPRHNRWMRNPVGGEWINGWNPIMSYNREGLYIMNRDTTNTSQMNINYIEGTDVNDNETACYTFDNTWSTGTGNIPVMSDPTGYDLSQVWYQVQESGLSFRPKWKL